MFGAWRRLVSVPIQYPFMFGVTVSTIKTSVSDLLVQKVVEKKEKVDWSRNMAFATFGCIYLGGVQYMIYVPLFSRLFSNAASFAGKSLVEKIKDRRGMFSLGAQVFLDQCVHHPLMYFPAFYATKELVMSEKPDLKATMMEYKKNMKDDLLALWKIWVPSTFLNFAFMPMWARIPWVAGTSLVWTCILSSMRGGDVVHSEDMAGGAVSGATMTLMKESLSEVFPNPVEIDTNLAHICVSASGPDKAGWVALITRAIANEGGNVTHSKMVRLGNEFIIMMHVAVPPGRGEVVAQCLYQNEELKPLNIRTSILSRRETGKFREPVMGLRIHCVGEDKPGMMATITEKLAKENLSVENITTEIRMGKNGKRNFVINCDCTASVGLKKHTLDLLVEDFTELKRAMNLDIFDIRVHAV